MPVPPANAPVPAIRALAILAALGLASCATRPPVLPVVSLIGGSEASLARLEAAARTCGADVRSIPLARGRWISLGRDVAEPDDPALACAMQWMNANTEEDLFLVGPETRV